MSDSAKALKSGAQQTASEQSPNTATGGFDFAGILAIADALPMPIAYLDEEQRYRFLNKAFADFFERPRSAILGLSARPAGLTGKAGAGACDLWRIRNCGMCFPASAFLLA